MKDRHTVLFIGRGATLDGLKGHFQNIKNLDVHHVEAGSLEEMKTSADDIVIVEHIGNHDNTCAILEEIGTRLPDSIVLLHTAEKTPTDKLIQFMNHGTRDIFTNDDNPEQVLRKAILLVERRIGAKQGEIARAGRVISLFSSKGGIGKTFLAVCVGRLLGQVSEFRTILVDLDLQFGDVDLYLNANSAQTIGELIDEAHNNNNRITDFILDNHIHKLSPSLHFLSAPLSPEKGDSITGQDIAGLIKMLKKRYDFVVLDTATALNEATLTAFDKSDRIFVVINDELASVKNAGQTIQLLKKLNYNEDKFDFLINRHTKNYPISEDLLVKTLTRKPYARIPASESIAKSLNEGADFVEKNKDDPAVQGVRLFLGKLATEWDIPFGPRDQKKKTGLAGMFFKSSA